MNSQTFHISGERILTVNRETTKDQLAEGAWLQVQSAVAIKSVLKIYCYFLVSLYLTAELLWD